MKNKLLIYVSIIELVCFIIGYMLYVIFINNFDINALIISIVSFIICLLITMFIYFKLKKE
jgi:Na+-driven multidrug efflux pump